MFIYYSKQMSTISLTKNEFIGKLSKFSKDRKVICIPNYMMDKLKDLEGKHIKVTIEEF